MYPFTDTWITPSHVMRMFMFFTRLMVNSFLLWLLEPYIVYKAYLWGVRFMAHPFTWEGELDWFAFMLTILLVIDVVALPLVIFYCPGLNPGVRVPDWIRRLGTPIYAVHNWLDSKVGSDTSTP
ncbi:hypothetical protein NE583_09750, partial [Veillonella parvula]|nr:hypothetical protein [Veillonella parvula]